MKFSLVLNILGLPAVWISGDNCLSNSLRPAWKGSPIPIVSDLGGCCPQRIWIADLKQRTATARSNSQLQCKIL